MDEVLKMCTELQDHIRESFRELEKYASWIKGAIEDSVSDRTPHYLESRGASNSDETADFYMKVPVNQGRAHGITNDPP